MRILLTFFDIDGNKQSLNVNEDWSVSDLKVLLNVTELKCNGIVLQDSMSIKSYGLHSESRIDVRTDPAKLAPVVGVLPNDLDAKSLVGETGGGAAASAETDPEYEEFKNRQMLSDKELDRSKPTLSSNFRISGSGKSLHLNIYLDDKVAIVSRYLREVHGLEILSGGSSLALDTTIATSGIMHVSAINLYKISATRASADAPKATSAVATMPVTAAASGFFAPAVPARPSLGFKLELCMDRSKFAQLQMIIDQHLNEPTQDLSPQINQILWSVERTSDALAAFSPVEYCKITNDLGATFAHYLLGQIKRGAEHEAWNTRVLALLVSLFPNGAPVDILFTQDRARVVPWNQLHDTPWLRSFFNPQEVFATFVRTLMTGETAETAGMKASGAVTSGDILAKRFIERLRKYESVLQPVDWAFVTRAACRIFLQRDDMQEIISDDCMSLFQRIVKSPHFYTPDWAGNTSADYLVETFRLHGFKNTKLLDEPALPIVQKRLLMIALCRVYVLHETINGIRPTGVFDTTQVGQLKDLNTKHGLYVNIDYQIEQARSLIPAAALSYAVPYMRMGGGGFA